MNPTDQFLGKVASEEFPDSGDVMSSDHDGVAPMRGGHLQDFISEIPPFGQPPDGCFEDAHRHTCARQYRLSSPKDVSCSAARNRQPLSLLPLQFLA